MRFIIRGVPIAFVFDRGMGAACWAPGAVAKMLSCGTGVFRFGVASTESTRPLWPPSRPILLSALWAGAGFPAASAEPNTAATRVARNPI